MQNSQNIGYVEIRVMVFVIIIYIIGFQICKDLTQRIVTLLFHVVENIEQAEGSAKQ